MKNKVLWIALSTMIVLSLVLASCGKQSTPTATTTAAVTSTPKVTITAPTTSITTTTTTAKTTTPAKVPQYGGTFTYRVSTNLGNVDPYWSASGSSATLTRLWMETLVARNWALDRNIFDFKIRYSPIEYWAGMLAESWENSNFQTVTFQIRKGIQWQDIPPMNGRELTASDIAYHFHRNLGLGSGFTKPSPYVGLSNYALIESVTATDKYTLVFKFKEPSFTQFFRLFDDSFWNFIPPRDAIEKWGDVNSWNRAIGTGPFILEDYISGGSVTFKKNPNYWGYDERRLNNRLSYVDGVKALIIPDMATALAALRTGKIDMIEDIIDYSDSYTLVLGSLVDKDIKLWDWTANKYASMIAAFNDLKKGRAFREFHSDILDARTQDLIKYNLKKILSIFLNHLCGL